MSVLLVPRFFVGNIFICQRPCTSAAGDADSEEEEEAEEEEENGSTAAGVVYKIGIKNVGVLFLYTSVLVCRLVLYIHNVVCRGSGSRDID